MLTTFETVAPKSARKARGVRRLFQASAKFETVEWILPDSVRRTSAASAAPRDSEHSMKMEASAQDEYVSDFDLEHLEEVVKREMLEQRRNAEAAAAYAHQQQQQQQQQQQHYQQQQQQQQQVQQHLTQQQQQHPQQHPQQPGLKHQLQVSDTN